MPKAEIVEPKKKELSKPEPPKLNIAPSDIEISKINLIQKSSQIEGPVGAFVLDQQHVIVEAGDEAPEVVIISAHKGWRENIPYESDEMPRIAQTEEQKAAIEADSEFGTIEFADITMLIPKPGPQDEDDPTYPYPIGDEFFALGRINVAKDAYRMTYKRLATFTLFNSELPVSHRLWTLKAEVMTKGKYSWFAPSLTITKNSPSKDVLNFVDRITS